MRASGFDRSLVKIKPLHLPPQPLHSRQQNSAAATDIQHLSHAGRRRQMHGRRIEFRAPARMQQRQRRQRALPGRNDARRITETLDQITHPYGPNKITKPICPRLRLLVCVVALVGQPDILRDRRRIQPNHPARTPRAAPKIPFARCGGTDIFHALIENLAGPTTERAITHRSHPNLLRLHDHIPISSVNVSRMLPPAPTLENLKIAHRRRKQSSRPQRPARIASCVLNDFA